MHIELRPHVGINLVTKQEQCHEQYLIYIGHPEKLSLVGLIGWKEGCKICYITPVDPLSQEKIAKHVKEQLKRDAESVQYPDIDQDLVTPPTEETFDEFNESDFT